MLTLTIVPIFLNGKPRRVAKTFMHRDEGLLLKDNSNVVVSHLIGLGKLLPARAGNPTFVGFG